MKTAHYFEFEVLGLVLFVTAISAIVLHDKYFPEQTQEDSGKIKAVLYVAAGISAFIMILGFIGCCGAWKEHSCFLTIYSIIMGILMVCIGAIGIAAIVKQAVFKEIMGLVLQKMWNSDKTSFHNLERLGSCCGLNGVSDYDSSDFPAECCASDVKECNASQAYTINCSDKYSSPTFLKGIVAICFLLALFCICALIMGACLVKRVKEYNAVPNHNI